MLDPSDLRTVKILLPTGDRIPFEITSTTTVSDLTDSLSRDPRHFVPPNRSVVLIYHGRILQSNDLLSSLDSLPEFTIHALFRPISGPTAFEGDASELRGFDRLARMNYSAAEIARLRDNFHTMQGTVHANREAQIEAEDEWFPVIFNNENPIQNLQLPVVRQPVVEQGRREAEVEEEEPYTLDRYPWAKFALGLFLGTFFGPAAVIFMLMPRSDRVFFAGLFLGASFQFVIKWFLGAEWW
jgi:hypothetical protein